MEPGSSWRFKWQCTETDAKEVPSEHEEKILYYLND